MVDVVTFIALFQQMNAGWRQKWTQTILRNSLNQLKLTKLTKVHIAALKSWQINILIGRKYIFLVFIVSFNTKEIAVTSYSFLYVTASTFLYFFWKGEKESVCAGVYPRPSTWTLLAVVPKVYFVFLDALPISCLSQWIYTLEPRSFSEELPDKKQHLSAACF